VGFEGAKWKFIPRVLMHKVLWLGHAVSIIGFCLWRLVKSNAIYDVDGSNDGFGPLLPQTNCTSLDLASGWKRMSKCVYILTSIYIYALLDMLWEPDRKGRKDVRLYVRRSGAGPTERHNGGTKDTRAAPKRGRSRREDTRETTGQGEISRLLRVNWKKCLCKVKKLRF
jgi:hypothetical protein